VDHRHRNRNGRVCCSGADAVGLRLAAHPGAGPITGYRWRATGARCAHDVTDGRYAAAERAVATNDAAWAAADRSAVAIDVVSIDDLAGSDLAADVAGRDLAAADSVDVDVGAAAVATAPDLLRLAVDRRRDPLTVERRRHRLRLDAVWTVR
jgi:hypothetical protein